MDLVDGDRAAGEQPPDPARTRAVERVDEHAHVLGPQTIEVERAAHVGLVPDEGVEALDRAGGLGVGERPPRWRRGRPVRDDALDRGQDVRAGRGAGRAT